MTWQERLDQVLESWRGTRYMAGACLKQRGADCRFFLVGVLDELYRVSAPLPPRLDPWTAQHDRWAAVRATRAVVERWPCHVLRDGSPLEPGDVVLCRRVLDGRVDPGHVLIAGTKPGQLWHTTSGTGVTYTGMGQFKRWVIRTWRTENKESWATR